MTLVAERSVRKRWRLDKRKRMTSGGLGIIIGYLRTGMEGEVHMRHIPRAQEIYRHFKGKLYQIVTVAKHSETGEAFVVYQAMYGNFQTYVRPLEMFMDKTDRAKYPDAVQEYRFELQDMGNNEAEDISFAGMRPDDPADSGYPGSNSGLMYTDGDPEPAAADAFSGGNGGDSLGEEDEEMNIDPMVLEFLDASTYGERLNILAGLHYRITDDMIDVMAMATDIEVKPGDIEERYVELRNCLLKLEKYECNRLRT